MGKYSFILSVFLLIVPIFCFGQTETLPSAIADKLDQTQLPQQLEKHDTTAVVPVPQQQQEPAPKPEAKDDKSFKFLSSAKDKEDENQPIIAAYIDIEETFNKNPWVIQARKNVKLDLQTKQIEFAQLKDQLEELNKKLEDLYAQLNFYKCFYEHLPFITADDHSYPKFSRDDLDDTLNNILFSSCDTRTESPANTPQKAEQLKSAIQDTKREIQEKQTYLLNYKELSKEEILSRQDVIIQAVLKEIYNGIKDYAATRNIALVVDKQEIIYGKPVNITPEFVKWMKSYHKKYKEQHGDIL